MNNTTRNTFDAQPETLEQIAKRVAEEYRKKLIIEQSILSPNETTSSAFKLDETKEEELKQIVTRASLSLKPEKDEEFLSTIPNLHYSWRAIELVNGNTHLQEIYAMIMIAIYQEKFPVNAEIRILCLDNIDDFVRTLTKYGHKWSRKAKTIMHSQHPELYNKMFEQQPRIYFFMD